MLLLAYLYDLSECDVERFCSRDLPAKYFSRSDVYDLGIAVDAPVAQSINVVGLIMVNQEGVWREPVYWPLWMQVHHSGPIALDAWLECETFDEPSRNLSGMPYLDCSVTLDPRRRKLYLSMVNRHREDALEIKVDISEATVSSRGRVHLLYHDDPMAKNSPADPDNVRTRSESVDGVASHFTWELKPHSYAILELDLG